MTPEKASFRNSPNPKGPYCVIIEYAGMLDTFRGLQVCKGSNFTATLTIVYCFGKCHPTCKTFNINVLRVTVMRYL